MDKDHTDRKLHEDSTPLKTLGEYPIAWMVARDSECDPPEFFLSESDANKNASLGLAHTHVYPLFKAFHNTKEVESGPFSSCPFCDSSIDLAELLPTKDFPLMEKSAESWAKDDRLWSTQETVASNLKAFAAIFSIASPHEAQQGSEACAQPTRADNDSKENSEVATQEKGKEQ